MAKDAITRKDALSEIPGVVKDFLSGYIPGKVRIAAESLGYGLYGFGKGTLEAVAYTHAAKSSQRIGRDNRPKLTKSDGDEVIVSGKVERTYPQHGYDAMTNFGEPLGVVFGGLGELAAYILLGIIDPRILAVPVVTNVASFTYEKARERAAKKKESM